jgi:nitroreductase
VCADIVREKYPGNFPADCAAATQNLLLALHGCGLGAVWCGVHPREERIKPMRDLLGLPEKIIPYALVPVGWPAEEKPVPDRFDAKRIHRERW